MLFQGIKYQLINSKNIMNINSLSKLSDADFCNNTALGRKLRKKTYVSLAGCDICGKLKQIIGWQGRNAGLVGQGQFEKRFICDDCQS